MLVAIEREHARADDAPGREARVVDGERARVAHDLQREVAPQDEPAAEGRQPHHGRAFAQAGEQGMSAGRRQGLDGDRDLLVIGGGVMGLFTAYHASQRFGRVVVLERGRIGDPMTASFGRTRSFRNDYLDATYARLAHEAFRLWGAFELQTATRALVRCGCLNIAKRSVTPELADTYAQMSHETLTRLGLRTESFDGAALRDRFDLDADMGRLDVDAGVVDLPAVTAALTGVLAERGVQVVQEVETLAIERDRAAIRVATDAGDFVTRSLVVTAGPRHQRGAGQAAPAAGCRSRSPRTARARRSTSSPRPRVRDRFTAGAMPVIAYLDTGIYCHPIVEGLVDAVKIGYYNPPDMPRSTTAIDSIQSFVERCMPGLRDAAVSDVEDVDQCHYDLVADDEFVLGPDSGPRQRVRRRRLAGHGLQVRPVGGAGARRAGVAGRHRLRHRALRSGALRTREDHR